MTMLCRRFLGYRAARCAAGQRFGENSEGSFRLHHADDGAASSDHLVGGNASGVSLISWVSYLLAACLWFVLRASKARQDNLPWPASAGCCSIWLS